MPAEKGSRPHNYNRQTVFCAFCNKEKSISPFYVKTNKTGRFYCNATCKGKWQSRNGYLAGDNSPMRNPLYAKKLKGSGNGSWRGGKYKSSGYVMVYSPNHPRAMKNIKPYVMEHILVMEKKIGRLIEDNESVHHINGIKDDNRPENLKILTLEEHSYLHSLLRERDVYGRFL